MATHSSILAWENPMDRGAWWATVQGSHKVRHGLAAKQKQQKPYHTKLQFLVEILGGFLSIEN